MTFDDIIPMKYFVDHKMRYIEAGNKTLESHYFTCDYKAYDGYIWVWQK